MPQRILEEAATDGKHDSLLALQIANLTKSIDKLTDITEKSHDAIVNCRICAADKIGEQLKDYNESQDHYFRNQETFITTTFPEKLEAAKNSIVKDVKDEVVKSSKARTVIFDIFKVVSAVLVTILAILQLTNAIKNDVEDAVKKSPLGVSAPANMPASNTPVPSK